jgi:integrase/recombinase XerD
LVEKWPLCGKPHNNHSFAVKTLLNWHARGLDVQPMLPLLSAYLGHVNPNTTYWYLSAEPGLLQAAASRLEEAWA